MATQSPVLDQIQLPASPTPWPTLDPFLFCVHHRDAYPAGDGALAPAQPLAGRSLGSDFSARDGWSMYHGRRVPGFPQHPHRGFETVTYVRQGYVDHSDSLGATARFGAGDTQWMTAGAGIVHAEMFPLLETERENPLELFQIWLNLPPEDKLVEPHFTMLWSAETPTLEVATGVTVTAVAGSLEGTSCAAPPPRSWAARTDADVAIWHLRLGRGADWTLPPARGPKTHRTLYFFGGEDLDICDQTFSAPAAARVDATCPARVKAGASPCELLMLQGSPIGAPVAQHGPFVMNTHAEIEDAFRDYQLTGFGGWPWSSDDPTHDSSEGRFARFADGSYQSGAGSPESGA